MPGGTRENAHLIVLTDNDEVRGWLAECSLSDSVRRKCLRAWKGGKYKPIITLPYYRSPLVGTRKQQGEEDLEIGGWPAYHISIRWPQEI